MAAAAEHRTVEISIPKVKWAQPYPENEDFKQVIASEKAASSSILCLKSIASTLAAESDKGIARICEQWRDRIRKCLPARTCSSSLTYHRV